MPNLTYTPVGGWYGTDTFTYKANDGTDDFIAATVTITVADTPEIKSIYMALIYR